jgi:hypothetical protein
MTPRSRVRGISSKKLASVSSTTGKPYLIRFGNGREVKSSDYLLAELKKLE